MRFAIFSAFPHELQHILKNLKIIKIVRKPPFKIFFAQYPFSEIIVVLTGMGIRNAEEALKYTLEEYSPDCILSIGFGGALYNGAVIGDLIWASKVLLIHDSVVDIQELPDPRDTFSRLSSKVVIHEGCVLTLTKWMKKSEIKKMIPRGYSFPVCDMEAFSQAKLSVKRGQPFFAIRSITDRDNEEVPFELLNVSDELGNYKLSRALRVLLSKPRLIPDSIKLGINSAKASGNLWHAVKSLIEILTETTEFG